MLHDGPEGLARQLDLPAVPTTYVLDRDGVVVLEVQGSGERELDLVRADRGEAAGFADRGGDVMNGVSSIRKQLALAGVGPRLWCWPRGGCATVRPYEKEHLADPIMLSAADAAAQMREMKWLDAREGSTGGVGGAGGGCACK